MKITQSHVDLWMLRRGPKWVSEWKGHHPNINAMINAKVRTQVPRYELAANNLLVILRGMRKRGVLLHGLQGMAQNPGTLISPQRRRGYCIKWLRRIGQGER